MPRTETDLFRSARAQPKLVGRSASSCEDGAPPGRSPEIACHAIPSLPVTIFLGRATPITASLPVRVGQSVDFFLGWGSAERAFRFHDCCVRRGLASRLFSAHLRFSFPVLIRFLAAKSRKWVSPRLGSLNSWPQRSAFAFRGAWKNA